MRGALGTGAVCVSFCSSPRSSCSQRYSLTASLPACVPPGNVFIVSPDQQGKDREGRR